MEHYVSPFLQKDAIQNGGNSLVMFEIQSQESYKEVVKFSLIIFLSAEIDFEKTLNFFSPNLERYCNTSCLQKDMNGFFFFFFCWEWKVRDTNLAH
jgi:hypothetical protein